MGNELETIKWDLVGIYEVRGNDEYLEILKSGHTLYHTGREDKSTGGMAFFINRKISNHMLLTQPISPRVVDITISLNSRYT